MSLPDRHVTGSSSPESPIDTPPVSRQKERPSEGVLAHHLIGRDPATDQQAWAIFDRWPDATHEERAFVLALVPPHFGSYPHPGADQT